MHRVLSGFAVNANGFSSLNSPIVAVKVALVVGVSWHREVPAMSLFPLSRGLEPEQPSHKV